MIQIIGRTGMLGSEICKAAKRQNIEVDESYIDITAVYPEDIKAELVINCAAITTPTGPDKSKMIAVNDRGPHGLAHACASRGARILHVSTDAVFNRSGPHTEKDFCDPSSSYGRTKMHGEIRKSPHLTVRTSFVGFGRHGILNQLLYTDDVITASDKFLWSGHTVYTVAEFILNLALREDITGLIHIPGEFQTRYQLVSRLVDVLGLSQDRVYLDNSYVTDRRLVSTRWNPIGLPYPPTFGDQLVELYNEYTTICSYSSRPIASS